MGGNLTQIKMQTNKIQINSHFYHLAEIQQKVKNKARQEWEKNIFEFILQWFDSSDYIVQHTSGSTGSPKAIQLKKSAMVASAQKTIKFFNLKKDDTTWLCLPINYIAGKMMVVRALTGKLNLVLTPPEGTPTIPDQNINFASMVPLQVQKLIDTNFNFASIEKLIIGGAPVDYKLYQAIQQISTEIYATYGMTETCSHIALQRINGPNPDNAFKTMDGVTISSDNNNCLQIKVSGITSKILTTTDMVEIVSPFEFKWLGRADNVINTGGIKVFPEILEKEISEIIHKECVIVPQADPLLGQKVVLVIEGKEEELPTKTILNQIEEKVEKHQKPKAVYYLNCFPRNQSMKTDRQKIKQLLESKQ